MNSSRKFLTAFCILVLSGLSLAFTNIYSTEWTVDKSHSGVTFEIRHFFTKVQGSFDEFDATINFDPDNLAESSIEATITAASINTDHERRDGDLRGENFFETETYPEITFVSSSIEKTGMNEFVAHGTLTVKGIEKDFDMPFTLLGIQDHPFREGRQIAGISSEFTILRNDFGIGKGNWVTDAILSYDVDVSINLELHSSK